MPEDEFLILDTGTDKDHKHADAIREAVAELNAAMLEAQDAGIKVEIDTNWIGRCIGGPGFSNPRLEVNVLKAL